MIRFKLILFKKIGPVVCPSDKVMNFYDPYITKNFLASRVT